MSDPAADQRPMMALLIRLGAAFVLSIMLVFVKLVVESGEGRVLRWHRGT